MKIENKIAAVMGIFQLSMKGIFAPLYLTNKDEHAKLYGILKSEDSRDIRLTVKVDGEEEYTETYLPFVDEEYLPFAPDTIVSVRKEQYPYTVNSFSWEDGKWHYEIRRSRGDHEEGYSNEIQWIASEDDVCTFDPEIHFRSICDLLDVKEVWQEGDGEFEDTIKIKGTTGNVLTYSEILNSDSHQFYTDMINFWEEMQENKTSNEK